MRRPLFVCLIGLVLGEAAAISTDGNEGFVWVLFILLAGCFFRKLSGKKQNRFFMNRRFEYDLTFLKGTILLLLCSAVLGNLLFLSVLKQSSLPVGNGVESVSGTISCRILDLKMNEEGNYDIITDKVLFQRETSEEEEKETVLRLKGKCRITGINKENITLYPDDLILCRGILREIQSPTNPGEFDAKTYYLARGIEVQFQGDSCNLQKRTEFSVRRLAFDLREKISYVYKTVMSEEKAALLQAMILGEKGNLDEEQKTLYEENGAAHLLAVSGLHISIVGGRLFHMLRKRGCSYGISCLGGGSLLLFYGCVTGFGNSVMRAIIMYLVYLGAEFFGSGYDLISSMSLSGILMLLEQPWRILEGGVQISFLSVLSIGLIVPWVNKLSNQRKKKAEGEIFFLSRKVEQLKEAFMAGLVITGCTLPFILKHFYECSPYSIVLNLLVIPCMTPLMIGGFLCGFSGLISLRAASCFGILPGGILTFFQWIFEKVRMIPGSLFVTGRPSVLHMLGIYLIEILLLLFWYYRFWWKLGGMIVVLLCLYLFRSSSVLQITMLDVGQGDGIFFQMPDGSNVLIDGGSSSRKGVGEYVLVPALKYYGAAALDYVIITHMDEDHISGIKEMLEQGYPVKHLILANIDQSDEDIKAFYKLAKQNKMIVRDMKRGEQLTFGKVTMCCLHPFEGFPTEDKNAASLVIYLKYGNFDGLFTGDLDQTGEEAVCNYVEEKKEIFSELTSGLEVLKVAHHGSAYSTDRDFLKLFCPKTALISVGKKNRYGHPHQELMQRLEEADCEIFQTRYSGAVEIKTDGNTWEIQYERN